MKIKFKCEYHGKGFAGFQRQSKGHTIQGVLESVLSQCFGEVIEVCASGRTDAGVHAREQVCHFICGAVRDELYDIMCFVNALLLRDHGGDIVVRDLEVVNDDFHARHSAKSKTYVYKIYVGQVQSPLRDDQSFRVGKRPNLEWMKDFVKENFIGKRDFGEYCSRKNVKKESYVREVFSFDIEERGDEIWFWVRGDGFLKHQVRFMVSAILGMGREIVSGKGLTLWSVEY